jgi:methionyl-tRNA formyltransferase
MRIAYLGTSAFAAAILEQLAAGDHEPVLVITRPDRPAGRGRKLTAPPVAETAQALGLALFQPPDVNDASSREQIAAAGPQAVVVCAFGALIKEPLLSEHLMLNVHPSLLPRWRGAAPIERSIMAGDAETGVSIMRLTEGFDSGPVCLRGAEAIGDDDDYATLSARLQVLGGQLLGRALDESPPFAEQDEDGVTYAEKITPADRTLDPGAPAVEQARVVRALHPHIGARIQLDDGSMLGVLRAVPRPEDGVPTGLLGQEGERLFYGNLELLEVQPPGKRAMPAADYLRGQPRAV